ncbi:MAG: hypothetical protein MI863_23635 [Desulfobacterales bacterium]|nr:hypothetical protein [Desulfobacterales bacterium]
MNPKIQIHAVLFILSFLILGTAAVAEPRDTFNPPGDLTIERTWTMMAFGESIGVIRGITRVEKLDGKVYIRQEFGGMVGVRPGVSLRSTETVWIGPRGMERFKGVFQETGSKEVSTMEARLEDDMLTFDLVMQEGDPVYSESFVRDMDYNWSTSYIDVERQGFELNKPFKKKILDIYALESREVQGRLLGIETVEQGGHRLECHKIRFDYTEVKGIMWLARDEFGWFIVKEEAESHGQPFQMYLDEYTKKQTADTPKKASGEASGDKKDFGF